MITGQASTCDGLASDLMPKFLALPCPRMFMYGEENSALSYLAKLAAGGVELAEIQHSGHWPSTPTRSRCGNASPRLSIRAGRADLNRRTLIIIRV